MKLSPRMGWIPFLAILFVLWAIWNNHLSPQTAGNFLGDLGNFLITAFQKTAQFIGGLGE